MPRLEATRSHWDNSRVELNPTGTGGLYPALVREYDASRIVVPAPDAYLMAVLADSPAGYWRLGEASGNPQDSSGNARHCTVTGGSPTYGVASLLDTTSDTAITLNGTNQYFTAPATGLDVADTGTWEIWCKRSRTSATEVLLDEGTNGATVSFGSADNLIHFDKNNVANIVNSTVAVTDTLRHHVVVTKSGASSHIYLDGNDVTGTITNQTLVATTTTKSIGASFNGSNFWFQGTVDEAAIYGTAISAARVLAHYNIGVIPYDPTVGFPWTYYDLTDDLAESA